MASLEELRSTRIEKLQILRDAGMDPYPADVTRDFSLTQISEQFSELESSVQNLSIVGRIMAIRGSGAIMFVVLDDGTGTFQAVLKKDEINEDLFQLFKDTVDMGDFVRFSGICFTTERGQASLLVKEWKMAGKALLPLPDKWDGIQDQEEIYRKRYLQLIADHDAFVRFQKRTEVIAYIRNFLNEKGFMEIETPILQNQAGGAMARTFNTHHNDLDMPMVLRISLEIEHKMIMAAGYPGIYEIGKNFRNEGSDPTHIQEFTMLEWYAAYHTLAENMQWTEELLKNIAQDVMGTTIFTVYDKEGTPTEVDFGGTWQRKRFGDLVQENAGLDIATASIDDIKAKAQEFGAPDEDIATTGRANLLDFIYKKSSRNKIINPTFVTDYPGDLKPLAQQNEDGTARVTQLIIAGAEITNQYAELVDPLRQRELLTTQSAAKEAGDEEAMDIDERFLTAMEHGMPPMTGFGMGIDRLMAILTNQKNLRDVIFFPIMRERE
ncbi:lysine--tRNA ligase [Candidatus Nomurabacteria bacterium]|nr:lysine--tRNA ligase [Candidatus Nomurabacteria bacterium]